MENEDIYTFVMIKPDMFERGSVGLLIDAIENSGFRLVKAQMRYFNTSEAEYFYEEHKGKEHFPGLVSFMVSGPVMGLVLKTREPNDAIKAFRRIIAGSAKREFTAMSAVMHGVKEIRSEIQRSLDFIAAEKAHHTSFRHRFGSELPRNAIHASDSRDAFIRESSFFFYESFNYG